MALAAAAIFTAEGGLADSPVTSGAMLGEWLGAPCRFVFQVDDGRHVEADCFTAAGLHHVFNGTYTKNDQIEGTFTRIDPAGCKVTAPGSVHIVNQDAADYSLAGFQGCGLKGVGAASHVHIVRVQLGSAAAPTRVDPKAQPLIERLTAMSSDHKATLPKEIGAPAPGEPTVGQLPMVLTLCVLSGEQPACAALRWEKEHYAGRFGNSVPANFGVEQWHSGGIVLVRNGAAIAAGTYKGRWLPDGTLEGSVIPTPSDASSPNRQGASIMPWTAAADPAAVTAHAVCSEDHPPETGNLEDLVTRATDAGDLVSMACFVHALAQQGKPVWQAAYSSHLLMGFGVARNPEQAFAWTLKAAEQNFEPARYKLREMYSKGIGTRRDDAKAAQVDAQLRSGAAAKLGLMLDRADQRSWLPNLMVEAANNCVANPEIAKALSERCNRAVALANGIQRNDRLETCHREAQYSTGGHAVVDPLSGRATGRVEGSTFLEDREAFRQCAERVDADLPEAADSSR